MCRPPIASAPSNWAAARKATVWPNVVPLPRRSAELPRLAADAVHNRSGRRQLPGWCCQSVRLATQLYRAWSVLALTLRPPPAGSLPRVGVPAAARQNVLQQVRDLIDGEVTYRLNTLAEPRVLLWD